VKVAVFPTGRKLLLFACQLMIDLELVTVTVVVLGTVESTVALMGVPITFASKA
jgi:hypothetical protein